MARVVDLSSVPHARRFAWRALLLAGSLAWHIPPAGGQTPAGTRSQTTDALQRAEAALAAFQESETKLPELLTALDSLARVPYEPCIGEFLCRNIHLRREEQRDDEFSSDYTVTFPCYGVLLRLGAAAIPEIFLRIPEQIERPFRFKPNADSGANRTAIPFQIEH